MRVWSLKHPRGHVSAGGSGETPAFSGVWGASCLGLWPLLPPILLLCPLPPPPSDRPRGCTGLGGVSFWNLWRLLCGH